MLFQVAATLLDCFIPGVGTVVEILDLIGAKIGEMKECARVSERLRNRLRFALDELKAHDLAVIKANGVLNKYMTVLESFLTIVNQYTDERGVRNTLKRFFKASEVLESIMELNEQLDDVLRLVPVEHLTSWLEWRLEYREDQKLVWQQLTTELKTIDKIYETVQDIQKERGGGDTLLEKVQTIKRDIKAEERARAGRSSTNNPSQRSSQTEASAFTPQLLSTLWEIVTTIEKKLGDDLGTPPQWIIAADEISVSEERLDGHRGRRSLSRVHVGEWRGAPVAVKMFPGTANTALFVKALTVWRSTNHPRVARLYGAGLKDGCQFFAFDLAAHKSLDLCMRQDSWSSQRWRLLHQAAETMAFLHREHIVHGNLSCAKILVDAEGNIKLYGFEAAYFRHDSMSNSLRPASRLEFKAPECLGLLDGHEHSASFASDVYSFGITVIESFGVVPFHDEGGKAYPYEDMLELKGEGNLDALRPAELKNDATWSLIKSMLGSNPCHRVSMNHVAKALKDLAAPSPFA